jgi:hypothetical protein
MVGAEVADLENDVLEGADGGFGGQARWVADDSGESFENGCSGGDDEVAGIGLVPVAAILYIC